ncbi:bifunctional folylpolyglutamate synthase/dihydrofolate synthase [Desulfopila sp. IMCC35006]|uniref:bifunctional folylpolyglutamate synthase/dihydrofolate synthase n=1 Tax=Desulfopila sp. IMCC35006 TaxID=2569542 RepID=UPI0010AC2485|nr:folylpolyglutamate synthase/dihydrofolate synthase family protein [Desulfopila sp. IMCC35006]TKB25333.1 bifunctional folylpolyglutamate synthase/dihydrofolate synthase [Desulfopila sp. IMCC35006]
MTYDEVLAHLDALQMHKIKLGLEAMQSFLAKVDQPESRLKFIHVAGTNGKGSVCAALSEVLGRAGYRIGVYTSPHLSSVRERFRIGGEYISEQAFAELGTRICQVLGDEQITYFEFTTALGLLWFAQSNVDLVVLETGMGGRLDATNVVTPLVSIITSVSMDHEAYLGDSLTAIAGEKAGIIKPGVPVVSGAIHPEVAPVIEEAGKAVNAQVLSLGQDFDYTVHPDKTWTWTGGRRLGSKKIDGLRCSRSSLVQPENDSLCLAALQLLQDHGFKVSGQQISEGLAQVKWPGRMEYFEQEYVSNAAPAETGNRPKFVRYLLDGAHNTDGVRNLAKTLGENFRYGRLVGVWGAMNDKDLRTTLGLIAPLVSTLILTQPYGERAATPEHIYSILDAEQKNKAQCVKNVDAALRAAQEAAEDGDLIVIGGSLYLIGEIRHLLRGELV